jgi:hypothetical protein
MLHKAVLSVQEYDVGLCALIFAPLAVSSSKQLTGVSVGGSWVEAVLVRRVGWGFLKIRYEEVAK